MGRATCIARVGALVTMLLGLACGGRTPGTETTDATAPDAQSLRCGDGIAGPGEECDDGEANADTPNANCRTSCRLARCADGITDDARGEECDDGNWSSHDGCSSGCTLERAEWVDANPTASPPGFIFNHSIAYDASRRRMVLFGGLGYNSAVTWEYDGRTWVETTPGVSPPTRDHHSMAYDADRGKVVLFGGTKGLAHLADTWEYDGVTWLETSPALSPPGRYHPGLAHDSARGVLVLFGGTGPQLSAFSDTWEYDGTVWVETTSAASPPGCHVPALAYDAVRSRVVLLGGWLPETPPAVWEYDGDTWIEVVPAASPTSRTHHALVFDATQGRTVLFGGWNDNDLSDTWEYDGATWVESSPSISPPARRSSSAAYDTARRRLVLFGGVEETSYVFDTWEYYYTSDWPDETCDNGIDDDSDSAIDCADPDCDGACE